MHGASCVEFMQKDPEERIQHSMHAQDMITMKRLWKLKEFDDGRNERQEASGPLCQEMSRIFDSSQVSAQNPILVPQAVKILDADAAADKEWEIRTSSQHGMNRRYSDTRNVLIWWTSLPFKTWSKSHKTS